MYDSICLKFKARKHYSVCVLIKTERSREVMAVKVQAVVYLRGKKRVVTGRRHIGGSGGTANI